MFSFYQKLTTGLAKVGLWFIVASYAIMTTITLIEVLRRYFFGLSFGWAEESVRFLLVTSTFIGGAVAYHKGSLVLFDVLMNRLSEKKAQMLNLLNSLIVLAFSAIVLKLGIGYIMTPAVLLQKSPGLGIPMFIPYAFIPLGFALILLFAIGNIVQSGRYIIRKEGDAI